MASSSQSKGPGGQGRLEHGLGAGGVLDDTAFPGARLPRRMADGTRLVPMGLVEAADDVGALDLAADLLALLGQQGHRSARRSRSSSAPPGSRPGSCR